MAEIRPNTILLGKWFDSGNLVVPTKVWLPRCASIRTVEEARGLTPCFHVVYADLGNRAGHAEYQRSF